MILEFWLFCLESPGELEWGVWGWGGNGWGFVFNGVGVPSVLFSFLLTPCIKICVDDRGDYSSNSVLSFSFMFLGCSLYHLFIYRNWLLLSQFFSPVAVFYRHWSVNLFVCPVDSCRFPIVLVRCLLSGFILSVGVVRFLFVCFSWSCLFAFCLVFPSVVCVVIVFLLLVCLVYYLHMHIFTVGTPPI